VPFPARSAAGLYGCGPGWRSGGFRCGSVHAFAGRGAFAATKGRLRRRGSGPVAALAVFVLGPVTFDRSIYIFLLSQFELAGTPLSQQALRNTFIRTYIDDWDQVGRRLREQEISGNLEDTPQGWQLTPRGAS
jgi:hypothetical protein